MYLDDPMVHSSSTPTGSARCQVAIALRTWELQHSLAFLARLLLHAEWPAMVAGQRRLRAKPAEGVLQARRCPAGQDEMSCRSGGEILQAAAGQEEMSCRLRESRRSGSPG